jgi:two-component system chemotaxis response regulator CheB
MGTDGLDGSRALVDAGGEVIAQDQASSVVWGMPGAIAQQGLASAVLPIDSMAVQVATLLRKRNAGVAA